MDWQRGRWRAEPSGTARVLRPAAVVVALGGVLLTISGFGGGYPGFVPTPAAASPDERFVASVRAQGRAVEPGADGDLLVRAAQKLCDRRDGSTSSARRQASALTADEIAAVRRTFGDDPEAFVKVALRTYCP